VRIPNFRLFVSKLAGLRRFPLPILAALIATAAYIVSIHSSSTPTDEQCIRISLTMLFGLPLLVGAVYGSELHPRFQAILHPAALIAMTGLFFLVPVGIIHTGTVRFCFWMLVLMAFALASVVPGLVREGSLNWWRVNVGWLNALVLAAIMTAIVEIGLQLALLSVKILFGLEAHFFFVRCLHFDLLALAGCLIYPVTALALFPSAKDDIYPDQPGFKVWSNLCKWALIPIGFLFMGILAAYAVKIIIQWKLPNGMVATPVLSLGAYGTLAMLLIFPWKGERPWARWFSLIYPPAFLLSSALLFISLALRIKEYGVTFDRYSALAAGIWLTVSAFCFLIRRNQAPLLVPFLLALTTLVAALGPLSAGTLSLRSQSERLKHLLESTNRKDEQIRSIVTMIVQDFGLADLEKVTGPLGIDIDPKLAYWELTRAVLQKLHLSKDPTQCSYGLSEGSIVPIAGCTAYLQARNGGWKGTLGTNAAGEELMLKTTFTGSGDLDLKLVLQAGGREVASKRIADLDFDAAIKNKTPILFTLGGEGRCFQIVITYAQWDASATPRKVVSIEYQVFEKQCDPGNNPSPAPQTP
jgi:hypothetical protein